MSKEKNTTQVIFLEQGGTTKLTIQGEFLSLEEISQLKKALNETLERVRKIRETDRWNKENLSGLPIDYDYGVYFGH